MTIKEAEVRGEKSFGMLCAPDELGLGDDHSGILILDNIGTGRRPVQVQAGMTLAEYLGLDDIIFEIDNKSLSNRPDLWCHYGIAREIAAIFGEKFNYKFNDKVSALTLNKTKEIDLKVEVKDTKLCSRYMALAMSNIKVTESPEWIKRRLTAAGMRPINNIVDATNYVMLEMGQPMHAFSMNNEKLIMNNEKEINIIVRRAKKGEGIKTLDGIERKLGEEMLVIADDKNPIAIAGVMGGTSAEISAETKAIIIESANFDPVATRKTATKLGLRTESSMRYEKSLDPNLCQTALVRIVELINLTCLDAKISSVLADVKNFKLNQGPLNLDLDWITKKIGMAIPTQDIKRILTTLGFEVKLVGKILKVKIPSLRATKDISIPEDIVEEIIRIYGYEKLTPTMPEIKLAKPIVNKERKLERQIKNILVGAPALTEVSNYSFVGEDILSKLNFNSSDYIKLANPITSNMTHLRQNIFPGLLSNIRSNQANFDRIGIFEIGNVFLPALGAIKKDASKKETLPLQEKYLSLVIGGNDGAKVFSELKGVVEFLFSSLHLPLVFTPIKNSAPWMDKNISAAIECAGKRVGTVASPLFEVKKKLSLKKETAIAELNLPLLLELTKTAALPIYTETDKFPALYRDLAFIIDAKILYNDIKNAIVGFNKLIKAVELFDVYEGDKIGSGNKSLAFHITYQSDRTLTAEEVDAIQKSLIKNLEEKFKAKVRDF
jgi:phenylalanyl-tRNA synthetase beta chain